MPRPETIQGRFKLWRQETERSLREVREAVNAHLPENRRVSVATVSNYETASMSPPRSDFVAALKTAYPDLNTTWLLTGDEAMTESEQRLRQAEEAANAGAELLEGVSEGFGDGAETVLQGRESPLGNRMGSAGLRRALLTHLRRRLTFTKRGQEAFLDRTLGTRIGSALSGPLEAMDVEPDDLADDALTDYVGAMTAALRAICPEPSKSIRARKEADDG